MRLCADPAIYVIDEGTASMKSHEWTSHAATRAVRAKHSARKQKRPMGRAARGIVILFTVLASVGSGAAATSAFASSNQPVHHAHQGTGTYSPSPSRILSRPWMY
jgi:hypothetical protein